MLQVVVYSCTSQVRHGKLHPLPRTVSTVKTFFEKSSYHYRLLWTHKEKVCKKFVYKTVAGCIFSRMYGLRAYTYLRSENVFQPLVRGPRKELFVPLGKCPPTIFLPQTLVLRRPCRPITSRDLSRASSSLCLRTCWRCVVTGLPRLGPLISTRRGKNMVSVYLPLRTNNLCGMAISVKSFLDS